MPPQASANPAPHDPTAHNPGLPASYAALHGGLVSDVTRKVGASVPVAIIGPLVRSGIDMAIGVLGHTPEGLTTAARAYIEEFVSDWALESIAVFARKMEENPPAQAMQLRPHFTPQVASLLSDQPEGEPATP